MKIWCKVWGCKWAEVAEYREIFRCHKLVYCIFGGVLWIQKICSG